MKLISRTSLRSDKFSEIEKRMINLLFFSFFSILTRPVMKLVYRKSLVSDEIFREKKNIPRPSRWRNLKAPGTAPCASPSSAKRNPRIPNPNPFLHQIPHRSTQMLVILPKKKKNLKNSHKDYRRERFKSFRGNSRRSPIDQVGDPCNWWRKEARIMGFVGESPQEASEFFLTPQRREERECVTFVRATLLHLPRGVDARIAFRFFLKERKGHREAVRVEQEGTSLGSSLGSFWPSTRPAGFQPSGCIIRPKTIRPLSRHPPLGRPTNASRSARAGGVLCDLCNSRSDGRYCETKIDRSFVRRIQPNSVVLRGPTTFYGIGRGFVIRSTSLVAVQMHAWGACSIAMHISSST